MSFLNKLQFWKREDEFSTPAYDLGAQHYDPLQQQDPLQHQDPMQTSMSNPDPFAAHSDAFGSTQGTSNPAQFGGSQYQNAQFPGRAPMQPIQQVPEQYHEQEGIHPRDVELILAKLDAIKSELDALHQRVRKIEQSNDTQSVNQKKYW